MARYSTTLFFSQMQDYGKMRGEEEQRTMRRPEKPEPTAIESHIAVTYKVLRRGLAVLAIGLPLVLSVLGYVQYGLALQESISAYYHASTSTDPGFDPFSAAGQGQMRDWFVGILWAVGVFLILYRGYGRRENQALNLAGILLILVAMFPMEWTCRNACSKITLHGVFAVAFFFMIGYVCIFRSGDTLALIRDAAKQANYRRTYRIIGLVMWVFPVIVVGLSFFQFYLFGRYTVFFIEAAGIWTFAYYWWQKSVEIEESRADQAALAGHLQRAPRKPGILPYLFDTTPHQPI
jgi:hypothetical protein